MELEKSIKNMLEELGCDLEDEHIKDTPKRVAKSLRFLTDGSDKNADSLFTMFSNHDEDIYKYNEMVILKNCDYYSMCSHHLLPFFGQAHIAYIPNTKVVGISKLARVVDIYARRLQIQERMTQQITQLLVDKLQPQGVMVVIEGQHLCMKMRGVQKQNSIMVTSAVKGVFAESLAAREEFLKLIKN